jgi:hypothetical protein
MKHQFSNDSAQLRRKSKIPMDATVFNELEYHHNTVADETPTVDMMDVSTPEDHKP